MRFVLIALLPLAACSYSSGGSDSAPGIAPSGGGTTRTYAVSDFTAVELAGSDNVDIRVGSAFSVRAEGPVEQLDKLKIDKDGDTLEIGRKGHGFTWGGNSGKGVTIHVTMPRIAEAHSAGSGDMTIDRVDGESFTGGSAGSGDMTIGTLNVGTADFSLAGSGNVTLSGMVRNIDLSIAGSGDIDAGSLKTESAKVSIAGSGNVKAEVNGSADVSILGSGDVDLGDKAACKVSKMGSGDVRCGSK